jgi:hypothetical protein
MAAVLDMARSALAFLDRVAALSDRVRMFVDRRSLRTVYVVRPFTCCLSFRYLRRIAPIYLPALSQAFFLRRRLIAAISSEQMLPLRPSEICG